jgi:hypothetical protein
MVAGELEQSPPLPVKTTAKVSQPTKWLWLAPGSSLSHGSEGHQAKPTRHPPAKVGSEVCPTEAANYGSYRLAAVVGSIRGKVPKYPFLLLVHVRKTKH